MIVKSQKKRI